ncbi:hypothetical protein cyc_02926 [Cyclospora cayetanensis]|uniref:Uncharacterized protein n=1 Tax=Cyclospora cayetanensis TaxID=88456 RepID=A0A1D3D7M4_9EIME|nr:hypothetical protein cyc_02926 [Cyclospora cayetanensis]
MDGQTRLAPQVLRSLPTGSYQRREGPLCPLVHSRWFDTTNFNGSKSLTLIPFISDWLSALPRGSRSGWHPCASDNL